MKLLYRLQKTQAPGSQRLMHVTALLGSMFHLATQHDRRESTIRNGMKASYWMSLMYEITTESDDQYYIPADVGTDRIITPRTMEWMAKRMCDPTVWGVPIGYIAASLLAEYGRLGWVVDRSEIRFVIWDGDPNDPSTYPISFTGDIDTILFHPDKGWKGLLDTKTHGMWERIYNLKGSISRKQDWGVDSILAHSQLRHYDWLLREATGERVERYGLVFPANLIPFQKGAKKGQFRGPILQMSASLPENHLHLYRRSIVEPITAWMDRGFWPTYPSTFGKPDCPKCPHFLPCIKDNRDESLPSSHELPDYSGWE